MLVKTSIFFSIVWSAITALPVSAQFAQKEKAQAIDSVLHRLQTTYVFPAVAHGMETEIRNYYAAGKYDSIGSGKDFAAALTRDLQRVSGDQHLKVEYRPKDEKDTAAKQNGSDKGYSDWLDALLKENHYGITEKKILEGNIGYLNIVLFGPLDRCVDSLAHAMQYVQNTDALIIDLRSCRGSLDENTIPFLCGYFFKEPVHLSDFYVRSTNFAKQFWSAAWVPGKRYADKPVYLLTSGRTFSGGEAFAYDLQQLKRALVLGETTRGGAHLTELYEAGPLFRVAVPYARTINSVSKTDWEGSGVQPDSLVRSNRALFTAHSSVLKALLRATDDADRKEQIIRALALVNAGKPQFKTVRFELEGYENAIEVAVAGSFNFFARKSFLLQKQGSKWVGETEVERGEVVYAFVVDGRWITDPKNPKTVKMNGAVHSVQVVD